MSGLKFDHTSRDTLYDASCKQILSEKWILAWIMKSCLKEYRDCMVRDIVEQYIEGTPEISGISVAPDETNPRIRGLSNEDTSVTEGTVTYDIRFRALAPTGGDPIQLIINVEAQNKYNPGYPLLMRAIYYCCRLISSQYRTEFHHAQYQNIRKVYSIWVCIHPPKEQENTINLYQMSEYPLVGNVRHAVQTYDLLSPMLICLGRADEAKQSDILRLLDVLFSKEVAKSKKWQIMEQDFHIPVSQELESEVSQLYDFLEEVKEEGVEEGVEKGILFVLQNLMQNLGFSLEQAMTAAGIPEAERNIYVKQLGSH